MKNTTLFLLSFIGVFSPAMAQEDVEKTTETVVASGGEAPNLAAAPESMEQINLRREIVYRVSLGRVEDVALLIKQGASVNALSDDDVPLVALAASREDAEGIKILKALLDAGADVGKVDKTGQNALFYAVRFGNREAVDYLLSKGIAYGVADSSGNTARSLAYDTGHSEIVGVLDQFVVGRNHEIKSQYEAEIKKQYEITYSKLQERYKAYSNSSDEVKNSANSAVLALRKTVYDMSFASCSAAYWQYCASSRRPTEITGRELLLTVSNKRANKNSLIDTLVEVSKMDRGLVYKITNISEVQIVYQLAILYYNQDKKEQDVGKIKDMQTRCGEIAKAWTDDGSGTTNPPNSAQNP